MRKNLFCSLLLTAVVLFFAAVSGLAETQSAATVAMRPYKGGRAVVAVTINGAGPYDLMVDTGATVTVLDSSLFQELGLVAEGSTTVSNGAGVADEQAKSSVKEMAVGGVSVQSLKVMSMKSLPLGAEYKGVRGILGENFLQHFDILFDNQHRKLSLDNGTNLAEALDGERLPMTFETPAGSEGIQYRPMVTVTVAAIGSRPVKMLLDSGSDALVLRESKALESGSRGTAMGIKTATGSMACSSSEDRLHWGKTAADVTLTTCITPAAKSMDHEGNLPTVIFQQLFISHAGSYAIVKPTKRAHAPEQIAALAPLAR